MCILKGPVPGGMGALRVRQHREWGGKGVRAEREGKRRWGF